MSLSGVRILIFQQRGWGPAIGHHIAKRLQDEGAELAALTFKPSTDRYTRSQSEVKYEQIRSHDNALNDPTSVLNGASYTLQQVCDELGIQSVWPFAQALRNHVRSYSDSYYYGYRQNVSDEGIGNYFQAAFHLCRTMLDEFKPDIVVAPNFVAVPHIFMRRLTKQRGIPMFAVTDTKVRGVQTFTHSYMDDEGPLIDRLNELKNGYASPNMKRAKSYIAANRKSLMATVQLEAYVATRSLYQDLRHLASRIRYTRRGKDRIDLFGRTADAPGVMVAVRDTFRHRQYARHANTRDYTEISTIGRFAFFPLQVQPEESLDVIAPQFNNQIETARQVAMSLPGVMTLVVKDHPAMAGLRKPSYLEKIARTPNVKLVDYRLPTDALLRSSELIIAPTGTVFAEAAILGVPGIQLGSLGTIRYLPNVVHHTDMTTLGEAIDTALAIDSDSSAYHESLERYVAAVYDAGWELDYFGLWERGNKEILDQVVDRFTAEVMRSLKLPTESV